MAATYLKKVSASRYRVYQRAVYAGDPPAQPLWQVEDYVKDYLVPGANSPPNMTTGVWIRASIGCVQVRSTADTSAWRVVVAHNAWTESGSWSDATSVVGSNDAEVAGKSSITLRKTTTQNDYATANITIPAGWAGNSLLLCQYGSTAATMAGDTRYTVTETASGRIIPLNGRGIAAHLSYTTLGKARANQYIDTATRKVASNHTWISATKYAFEVELARNLPAGTYTVKVEKTAAAANEVCIGRLRAVRNDSSLYPGQASTVEYFDEAMDLTGTLRLGSYSRDATSTNDIMVVSESGSSWTGGYTHGCLGDPNGGTGNITITADSTDITATVAAASNGTWFGPYTELKVTIALDLYTFDNMSDGGIYWATTKAPIKSTGATATWTAGQSVLSLNEEVDLSTVLAGDLIKIAAATWPVDSPFHNAMYVVASVDDVNNTVTVTTPLSDVAGKTGSNWGIWPAADGIKFASTSFEYLYANYKTKITPSLTWLGAVTISTCYLYGWTMTAASGSYYPYQALSSSVYGFSPTHLEMYNGSILACPVITPTSADCPAAGDSPPMATRVVVRSENLWGKENRDVGRVYVRETPYGDWSTSEGDWDTNSLRWFWTLTNLKTYVKVAESLVSLSGIWTTLVAYEYTAERDYFAKLAVPVGSTGSSDDLLGLPGVTL